MPLSRSRDRRRFGWLRATPVAHRGLHGPARPENGLRAFAAAARRGFAIELDVHLSADGEAIVFHDDNLRRMTGTEGQIRALTAADLATRRLLGSGEPIPTLGQVLGLVAGRVPILIEIKTRRGAADALAARVAELIAHYRGPVAVQSFDPRALVWFARHRPAVPRGQLSTDYRRERVAMPLGASRRLSDLDHRHDARPDFIGYHGADLPRPVVTRLKRLGLIVLAWTVRSRRDRRRLAPHVDNVIFEGFTP